MNQAGLFRLSDHLKRLSANGDPLEELSRIVDFESFCAILESALAYANGAKVGRPPYDCVAMFKILILAVQNNVADARMEYLIRDRLSWLRFLGFDHGTPTPDANTIRLFRDTLTGTVPRPPPPTPYALLYSLSSSLAPNLSSEHSK